MRSLVVGVVVVGAAVLPGAAELLSSASAPDGYELVGEPATDLGFEEFAGESPYSVGHVESGDGFTGALDVWALGDTDVLLREMSSWPSTDLATEFVTEIEVYAEELGLDEATAPFDGAQAFSGPDDETGVWVRMVVWSDDRIGALINHFSVDAAVDPGSGDVDAAANALAAQMAAATAAASPNDPLADGGDGSATPTSGGGGIPITTVLLWLVIIGGGIWLFVKLRRKLRAAKAGSGPAAGTKGDPGVDGTDSNDEADGDGRNLDDIIERARARSRAQEEIDAIPDPADEWTPPDDY